jgi:hypothetical protein
MKFRASFSTLSQWASGNWQRAIEQYFKINPILTKPMAEGREWHKRWAEETRETSCLPAIFGGKKLENPTFEKFMAVDMADWLQLRFIVDCFDGDTIYEYKTGKTSSEVHANSPQVPIYGVGLTLLGHLVKKAEVHHYDQHQNLVDMSMIWLTDKVLDDAQNWLITNASEMFNYLTENRLFEKFGGNLK